MLKTHYKSLLALALVPTLFAAQLTGLMGSTPAAKASLTFAVSATPSVAPGGTLTVTASGIPSTGTVTITVNAPSPSNASSHYDTISAGANGDTAEYGAGYSTGYLAAGYANALTAVVTAVGGVATKSFTVPGDAVPGTYGISVADTAGDYGTTTSTVTGSNSLLVNGNSTTQSVSLGQEFSVYYGSFTAGTTVSFSLANLNADINSAELTASGVTGLVQGGATLPTVPLTVVSCNGAAPTTNTTCLVPASGGLNATLALSAPTGSTPIVSSAFFDQVYSIVATTGGTPGVGTSLVAGTHSTTVANNAYPVTITATGGNFTLTVSNAAGTVINTTGPIAFNATIGAVQTALTTLAVVGAGGAVVTGTPGAYTVTFAGTAGTDLITGSDATALTPGGSTAVVGANAPTVASSIYTGFTVTATGGTYTVTVSNAAGTEVSTTAALPFNTTMANLATALGNLTSVGAPGNVTVTPGTGSVDGVGPYIITFTGAASGDTLTANGAGLTGSTASTGTTAVVHTGIKIDHSRSTLTAGASFVAQGATVSVSGYNWAASSEVAFFFVDQIGGSGTICAISTNTLLSTGVSSLDSSYTSNCFLGTTTASTTGSFSGVSLTLPTSTTNGSYSGGKVVAVDIGELGGTAELGHRLNESAFVPLLVSSTATGTGGLSLSATTAAIGQTLNFTGTGFLASTGTAPQYVTLTISGGDTCSTYPFPQTLINTSGVALGSFTLPTSCGLAGGDSVTVSLTGPTSGGSQTLTATLVIASTTITATTNGTTITYSGTGFQSSESVALQLFSTASTGTAGTALAIVTANADGTITPGNVAVPSGLTTGYYYIQATGASSGLTATANVGYSVGGVLNVPSIVIPGETVTVTGTQFSIPPSGATGTNTLSVNFSPTPVSAIAASVDASGVLTATFTVPTDAISGTYTLTANAYVPGTTIQQQRYATLNVVTGRVAVRTATPASVAVGGTSAITATGFLPAETVTVALQYTANGLAGTAVPGSVATFTADSTGTISGTFTVKSSVGAITPGSYNLVATGSSSKLVASVPFVVAGTGVTAATSNIYFAEGFTGTTAGGSSANFTESISILNANNYTTTYTVTYFLENKGAASTTKVVTGTIGADSVVERAVNTDAGSNVSVASEVSSPAPLAASRIIARSTASGSALDSSSSLGQQLDLTASGPFSYYFASGDVMPTNEQYLTLLNPNNTAANVTVTILPQAAVSSTSVAAVTPISITVPANSRVTEPIRKDLLSVAGLTKFGVSLSSNVPVAAERVEYYGDGTGSAKYGATTKPASSSAQRQYVFAADSGTFPSTGGNTAIGTGSDISEVDVINPAPSTDTSGSATVTVSFFDKTGKAINSQQVQVDAGTRETISVNDVAGTQGDVFSTVVTSDKAVFAERPTFYGGDPTKGGTFAAITPTGAPAGLTSVAFPYLDLASSSGAAISQTVFLYNPGGAAITVRGIFAAGTQTVVKTYTVPAGGITAVSVNADASTLTGAIGGIFQIVTGTAGASDSFVALAIANTAGYKVVTGDQGTYPVAASTGF